MFCTVRRFTMMLSAVALLSACATAPTPYGPATNGGGYSEQQIESNRFRVSFVGNTATSRETVENYLLYRAAEITLAQERDYFVVTDMDTEARRRGGGGGPTVGVGGGFGSGGRTFTGIGIGLGVGQTTTDYRSHAYIVLYDGEAPADNPRAYNARDIFERIGPQLIAPSG